MNESQVTYEVWSSKPGSEGPEFRVFSDRSTIESANEALRICCDDKAAGYPESPIEFYIVRVTTIRERA